MAIKITENSVVNYENEPNVDRELFPNISETGYLPEDYQQLIRDVNTLKSDVTTINGEITEIQGDVTTAEENIDDIEEEIGAIKNDLSEFPNGNYPQMGAGYANQLVSGLKKEDSTPYNFRRIPYDATLEEVKKIVGGTVVNNQLVDKSKLTSGSSGNHTVTPHDDGSITLVVSGDTSTVVAINLTANSLPSYLKVPNGHKFAVLDSNPQPNGVSYGNNYNGVSIGYNTISDKTSSSGYILLAVRLTNATEGTYTLKPQIIDLTQDFGTSIADYVYSLETATAGAGVAWLKKHFPKQFDAGYQAYDAGSLQSVSGLTTHKMIGFNQWDEEVQIGNYSSENGLFYPTSYGNVCSKNPIRILPDTEYYVLCNAIATNINIRTRFYNSDMNYIGYTQKDGNPCRWNVAFTTPVNAYFMNFEVIDVYGKVYNHDICVNLSDPTKNGTYEPYEAHSYALDSDVVLRGIPKLNSNNQLYYDGDEYLPDGTVNRRWKKKTVSADDVVQVGTASTGVNWARFSISPPGISDAQLLSTKYLPVSGAPTTSGWIRITEGEVYVYDNAMTDLSTAKALLDGLELIYPVFAPTSETADPYTTPQIIAPDGTEEYVYADGAFELPVGHSSDYPVDVSGQLDDILDTPSANGTYVLKATVTDGAVTYSWVADA